MTPKARLLRFWRARPLPFSGELAWLLAVVEILIDWGTWIELNLAAIYGLPLVLAAASGSRRLLWGLAFVLVGATFVVYVRQMPTESFYPGEPYFINRTLSAMTVLLMAALLHALTLAVQALDARGREAEAASGRKSELLASVSHDMRTPLTAITLIADLIRTSAHNPALAPQLPALAQTLQGNALSLSDMVTDVLDAPYFESGELELHESEFSIGELLAAESHHLATLAQARNLKLSIQPAKPDIWVRADRVKLARVVRNLVNNAINYTDEGSVSISSAVRPGSGVMIHVADTGIGISRKNLQHIFDEYAQAHTAGRQHIAGWGLGLAICRRLTELMGGRIVVESEPGKGSVFTVQLPAWRRLNRPSGRGSA